MVEKLKMFVEKDFLQLAKRYLQQRIELGEREIFAVDLIQFPSNPTLNPSPRGESEGGVRREKGKGGEGSKLQALYESIRDCQRCLLSKTRTNLVFGVGNPKASLVFIGEAPGREEDLQGEPFVGAAGQLLTKIIEAIEFKRSEVYITNVIKCRPPENRNPLLEEIANCEPYLIQQLSIIKPKIICALGTFAAQTLLKTTIPISLLRGKIHYYQSIKVIPTYHPAALLRNPGWKRQVWEDMKLIKEEFSTEYNG
ncbi:MAG: uracil-DNA glycosylase [Candidatus Edwardsbacteria bacterium]